MNQYGLCVGFLIYGVGLGDLHLSNHLAKRKWFVLWLCSVFLSCGAIGWSVICNCGIVWSFSLAYTCKLDVQFSLVKSLKWAAKALLPRLWT